MLNPFVIISKDTVAVEDQIIAIQQKQQENEELREILVQFQEVLARVEKTILDEPWMEEKDQLIQTLFHIREQSPDGGSWDKYQEAADKTIRMISAQVREMIIQPLEGVVHKNERTRETMPKLSQAVKQLRMRMEIWEERLLGERWYATVFSKDEEMRELTYSLNDMLKDITDVTRGAITMIKGKEDELDRKMVELNQEIADRREERDRLNEEMQKILPEWLRGIITIEQMMHLFPVFIIFLVVIIMILALILAGHFEKAAVLMDLEKEQREDPVFSSIWTLTYRKIYGTVLTILTYLIFLAVMWFFF